MTWPSMYKILKFDQKISRISNPSQHIVSYKISAWQSIVFLYTKELTEKENKKKVKFIITTRNIKTKEVTKLRKLKSSERKSDRIVSQKIENYSHSLLRQNEFCQTVYPSKIHT